jgi:hypothetical protein
VKRVVETELLDELPVRDPRALRSRRDIHRLNAFMGNAGIMAAELKRIFSRHLSFRLMEIGGGDGDFLLRVARRVRGKWRGVEATVLDREDLLETETQRQFADIEWQTRSLHRDVFQWVSEAVTENDGAILSNLFLHQFDDGQLRELLRGIAGKTRVLVAVEPRRSRWALFSSYFVGLLGCNDVTRHDARVSVRAGFAGHELSALWPDPDNWELTERSGGWFSHVFIARRKDWMSAAASLSIDSAEPQATGAQPVPTFPFRATVNSTSAPRHES